MDKLTSIIEKNYALNIYNIEKIKNAYRLHTDKGYKCFKCSHYDIEQYEFIINTIEHLVRNGYENILKIDQTIDNRNYIELEDRYGFICDWIQSSEVDFDDLKQLRLSVISLAKLHVCSRGFNYEHIPRIRDLYFKWDKRFKKRCDELLYFKIVIEEKKHKSQFDHIYLEYFDEYYYGALKAVNDLNKSEYRNVMKTHKQLAGLCHHDTANHNFLITPSNELYLVDFDYCIYDSHLHDLGSIIIRNMRHGNWSASKLKYIVNIYNEVISLNTNELEILRCFIEFPQDFWQIGLQYYVERQNWTEDVFIKRLLRCVGDTMQRNIFLKDLEGGLMLDILK